MFSVAKRETTTPTKESGKSKLSSRARACIWKTVQRQGSTSDFHSKLNGACVFSPLARVQPHNPIQLASLEKKKTDAQEMKEAGAHCPRSTISWNRALGLV